MFIHSLLRIISNLVPPISIVEKRFCNFLQKIIHLSSEKKVKAGNGFWMTGDTNNLGYLTGLNERKYMQKLGHLIVDNQTVFNIGANTGYLALWLTRYLKQKNIKLVAFEPEPSNVEWLGENIALNCENQVTVEPCAVGSSNCKLTLWSSGRGDGSASFDKSWGGEKTIKHDVDVVTLDAYCKQSNYHYPDWIILDVEGFGGKVIEGAIKTLDTCKPCIASEIHSDRELLEMESVLLKIGYKQIFNLQNAWGHHIAWKPGN